MRRRLGEQKPFIWYQGSNCILFVEDGVFKQHINTVECRHFAPYLWAFVDADDETSVPSKLAGLLTNLYVMFTTPPREDRWKPMSKTTDCMVVVMNPWYLGEILQA